MAGTRENVLIAAVDNIKFDLVDVGFTDAPFTVTRNVTFQDIFNEQFMDPIKSKLTESTYEAGVSLQEGTLENYARGWNLPQSNVTSTASSKSLALNSNLAGETAVLVTGKPGTAPLSPPDLMLRVIDLPQVQVMSATEARMSKSEVSNLAITMRVLADETGLNGTFRDQLV